MHKYVTLLLISLSFPLLAETHEQEPRIRELKGANGRTIKAVIKEVSDNTVKLKMDSKNMSVSWDKFDPSEHQLFQDYQKYHKKPLDVNLLENPDEKIVAGQIVEYDIAGLEEDVQGNSAGYTIRVPENYHPMKSMPLF